MRVLIIDPNLSLSSPAMKGVVRSLAAWKERGIKAEAWCWYCDEGLPLQNVCKLPRIPVPLLGGLFFAWQVFWRAWWQFTALKQPRPDVIYTIGWYHKACDVAHVHFSPFDWENRQRVLGTHSLRDFIERLANRIHLHRARRSLRETTARTVLCVSEAVANDMRTENPRLSFEVLPNSYDPERFHPGVRGQWRESTRAQLNYETGNKVFIFVSTGHYRRKGFFLAVDALRLLRQTHPEVRFLVVGGREERLAELRAKLGPGHEWITFTGMVPDVEKYLAAADALLFPSCSEAFALVEVEAAACGLPLFLTPHHGSEMILEDRVNGRLIEFDPVQIVAVLTEFVEGRWEPQQTPLKHALDASAYAQRLGDVLMHAAASKQMPS